MDGQVALITGAGRGIGAAAARALARRGCKVAVWDRHHDVADLVVRTILDEGGDAIAVYGSVAVSTDVSAAVGKTLGQYGTIHILVNNAGFGIEAPVWKLTDEQWASVLDVNLTGSFYCIRAVAPSMIAQRYGRVVNISSRAHMGDGHKAAYASAKAGILGLTRTCAIELGEYDITVNAIAPGMVRTERVLAQPQYAALNERAQARQLIKRPGTVEDIVNGILFYASPASGFVTGDTLYITGGRMG